MLLVGAIGWGLLAVGAVTHVWHHQRLRELLAMHLDHERLPALALTALEVALAILLPLAVAIDAIPLTPLVVVAVVLAIGFCGWIGRLLITRSDLPCACSFSDAPTTIWSLARAAIALCVVALAFESEATAAITVTTFAVGMAVAVAVFVVPDAIAWPEPSRALLERARAHRPVQRAQR